MLESDLQNEKALFPMLVSVSGSLMDVSDSQFEKALLSILVSVSGSLMELSDLQP